jgi:hypothetical protein
MKYIDNLIKWADYLFRQDSMEANNEATLLYILAYKILGQRPVELPTDKTKVIAKDSYEDLRAKTMNGKSLAYIDIMDRNFRYSYSANNSINDISNPQYTQSSQFQQESAYKNIKNEVLSNAKTIVQESQNKVLSNTQTVVQENRNSESKISIITKDVTMVTVQECRLNIAYPYHAYSEPLPRIDADNFCVPFNEDLLKYWDTVEDRLFKLRNSMNIEGMVRELPLFEPPIDPAMLVKAVAAGLSIGEVLNDITARQPYYRFRTIMQKAIEFTNEVKQMGDKLLSTLEKKDAETLNILRSTQEINMQKALKQVRKLQIDEAKENIENINALIATATARKEYYESREFMNTEENRAWAKTNAAFILNSITAQLSAVAVGLSAIPQFSFGAAGALGSPVVTVGFGGQQISAITNAAAMRISGVVQNFDREVTMLSTKAVYQRRKEDWDFQAQMADMELVQLNRQLTAAEIRLMMAEKELENLNMQIEQSQSVKEYYQDKYTSEALYNWMITQISSVYYQAYKLAYDMAKKAENCYCYELGIYESTNFIQFGYWDSLKKGLLSGDKLMHDLHLLEAAYLDNNKRTFELTKHIAMAQMYPGKLIELIANKETMLDLEEFIFDMDYPGHYMRRIKSVSVTIPNVAGPCTAISFMLTLQKAQVRKEALLKNNIYVETEIGNDSRFVYQTGGNISQSICTSSAQNDSGLFELNFGDERYLPFENAGAISSWKLSFPAGVNQFDLSSISDVILHISYTALYDGKLADSAKLALKEKLPEFGTMFFSPKQDFPDAWNQMEDNINSQMNFVIETEHFPFFMRGQERIATTAVSILISTKEKTYDNSMSPELELNGKKIALSLQQQENGNIFIYAGDTVLSQWALGSWNLQLSNILPFDVEDIVVGVLLQAGVDEIDDGNEDENNPDSEIFLLTNSLDKLVTNSNQYITLNNLNS